jgi:hypothetical protein
MAGRADGKTASGRRGRGFDPTTVDITPKHPLGSGSLPAEVLPAAA